MARRAKRLLDMTSVKTAAVIVAILACFHALDAFSARRASLNPPEECARTQLLYIRDGQQGFHRRHGRYGTLAELAEGAFVGPAMRLGTRDHYRFDVQLEGERWSATAKPLDPGEGRPAFAIVVGDDAPHELR